MVRKSAFTLALAWCLGGFTWSQAVPASKDLDTLKRFVSEGKGRGDKVIRIPAGVYRVDDTWDLRGLTNTTLDGQGSTILYTGSNWNLTPWTSRFHSNATIRNFIYDYEVPPLGQGRVEAVEEGGRVLVLKADAGYPDFARIPTFKQMYLFDSRTRGWKAGTADLYPEKIEVLSANRARVTLPTNLAPTFPKLQPGDLYGLTVRTAAAFAVYFGTDLTLENLSIRASPSLAFVIRYQKGGLLLKGCRVERGALPPGASEPRLMSTGADALNVAYLSSGMRVENCDFGWMGDDSINIHGGVYPVIRTMGRQVIIAKRNDLEALDVIIQPGSRVRSLEGGTFRPLAEGVLTALGKVENGMEYGDSAVKAWWPSYPKTKVTEYGITLAEGATLPKAGDWVEFPAINGDGYVIKNNYFHDHRARCVRIQAGRGLIEGNRFERIGHAGLSIGPEYTYWREAGWAQGVVIRSNSFKDIGMQWNLESPYGYCPGAISLFFRPEGTARPPIGNRDILIEGNRIDGCTVAGIHINASEAVTIRGNTLKSCNLSDGDRAGSAFGLSSTHAITVQYSRGVVATSNTILTPGRGSRGDIRIDAEP